MSQEDELIEYDDSDFMDVFSEQAKLAEQMHKKDETQEGKRQVFDSADYWMDMQKNKGNKDNLENDNKSNNYNNHK